MNGEMYQISSLVASTKQALRQKSKIKYKMPSYELAVTFDALDMDKPERSSFKNVEEWYKQALKRKLTDVKFLTPAEVKDRHLLAFAGARRNLLTCFYEDGEVTYSLPKWTFNTRKKGWDIHYVEHRWENPPQEKPVFPDNTEEFAKVLDEIAKLADDIECDNFAHLFRQAGLVLAGETSKASGMEIPLPEKHLNMFHAASSADVFGGMGSWNDSPWGMAREKDLSEKYEELSSELYKQIVGAVLFAVNEW
ncbi:hypothetical protein [Paenibacillus sanguinis]|uniref:hypothetical protein n=1 Tax=Paenibacillus sanguinis TaxID=225906 RepID=UPI0003816069|nr:hypothetical protein [Paenibacillus sanguinis]